jgi:site-specific DNA-methyltransferase (adenine-specific)
MSAIIQQNEQASHVSKVSAVNYELALEDAFEWLASAPSNSIHGVVTDPPYALREYDLSELQKRQDGRGGVWRIPPALDGYQRSPLPRFTVLDANGKQRLEYFFYRLATGLLRVLVPGAHVFIATNPILSHHVYYPFVLAGFEKRGEVIRVVSTLRGGDRPKNAHKEFCEVTVMPKSCWEPWGIFRKPLEGRVQDNLRKWGTGGLRRKSRTEPFKDLILSSVTPRLEREIAPHPSLKPQAFLRELTRAVLPISEGIILDPFMGSGPTIAAAQACNLRSVGIESNPDFFKIAVSAIPRLSTLYKD